MAGDVPAEVLEALGTRRDRRGRPGAPSLSTFRRVLRKLDGQALAAAFGAWLPAQVLAGLADTSSLVIAQKGIDAKTNEITQVRPLLDDTGIAGALVTADALHVQKDTARYLAEDKKADYLFTAVKDNQPSLFAALDALDWQNTPVTHVMRDRGHGRDETRTIQVLPAPDGLFPHAAQAFLIERYVRDPGTGGLRSAVAALGITSRAAARGGTPEALALAARGHWETEALHHVRDVTMKQDAQHLRAGTSPQVTASLRNTAITALRLTGFTSTATGRRWTLAALNLI